MSAIFQEFHQWESAPALKLLLPQRDEQFTRSAAARNNRVVKPTGRPYLSILPGAQPAIALPSKPQSPAAAGWAPTLTEVTK